MFSDCLVFACVALIGCGSTTATPAAMSPSPSSQTMTPAAPDSTADAPPPVPLRETPPDQLGSVPPRFGLAVGSKAPDATLPDVTGMSQRLSALYAAGPVFVVFYRGGWCPFCNL